MLRRRMPLVLIFVVSMLLSLGILGMDAFVLQSVTVEGSSRPNEVLSLANVELGGSIFRVDLGEVEKRIESSPYFEVIASTRNFPSGITFRIRERSPIAVVHWLDAFHVIDQDGTILETTAVLPALSCPVVSGMQVDTWETGNKIASVDARQTQAMDGILMALGERPEIQSFISQINVSNPEGITLISPLGLVMDVGDARQIERQMEWIEEVVPRLYAMGYSQGRLTLTSPGRSVDFLPQLSFASVPASGQANPSDSAADGGDEAGAAEDGASGDSAGEAMNNL